MNVQNINSLMWMDNVMIAKLVLFQMLAEEHVLCQYSIVVKMKSILLMEEVAKNVQNILDLKMNNLNVLLMIAYSNHLSLQKMENVKHAQ